MEIIIAGHELKARNVQFVVISQEVAYIDNVQSPTAHCAK
jgi:hypothetical protein